MSIRERTWRIETILRRAHVEEMYAHARESGPSECCGLIGGEVGPAAWTAQRVYRLRNVAPNPHVSYEAAADDLFAAQKLMRSRGEQLVAIYHSHPAAAKPLPSETDVRLAYYPSAVYFIIGLGGGRIAMEAFRIFEAENRWEAARYSVID